MYVLGRPTAYHHTGDEAVCSTYLPFARKKLESLFKRTPEMCRRQTFPLDGVGITIIAAKTAGKIIITAGTEYLDTGFYDHRSFAPLNSSAFLPSHLYYATPQVGGLVQGKLSIKAGVASGAEVLPERDSIVMGGTALVKTAPNGFTSPTAIYSSDIGLLQRKNNQRVIQPSNYCGLTALYVQCLYGSKTTQNQYYAHNVTESGAVNPAREIPSLVVYAGDFHFFLKYDGAGAPWVVCNNWKYWFVTVNDNGSVSFRRINTVLSNPAVQSNDTKVHAALLAGSRLAGTDKVYPCTKIIGQPLYYGWKTNELGTVAKIVAHGGDAPYAMLNGREYTATVLFDAKGAPSGLDVSVTSQGYWATTNSVHCLYAPYFFDNTEIAFKGLGSLLCNAPLYVTARDGILNTQRIVGADSAGGAVALGTAQGTTSPSTGGMIWTVFNGGPSDVPQNGDGVTGGVYEFYHYTESDLGYSRNALGVVSDTRSALPTGDGVISGSRIRLLQAVDWTGHFEQYWDRTTGNRPLMLIPFSDCNALLQGLQFSTYTGRSDSWDNRGGFLKIATYEMYSYTLPSDIKTAADLPWETWGEVTYGDPARVGTWAHPEGLLYLLPVKNFTRVLGDFTGSQTAQVSVAGALVNVPIEVPGNVAYFSPELGVTGNPEIPRADVQSSLGGSYKYRLSFAESGVKDWPATTSNPVGWA